MAAVARAKEAIRSTFTPGVVGDVGGLRGPLPARLPGDGRPAPRRLGGRRRDEDPRRHRRRRPRHRRPGHRQPLRRRHPRPGRQAPLLPRLRGDRDGCAARSSPRSSGASRSPAARTAAPSSAARRPRCRGCTPTATTTSPGRSSASSTGRSSSTARGSPRATSSSASRPPAFTRTATPSPGCSSSSGSGWARTTPFPSSGATVAEALLAVHRSYLKPLLPLVQDGLLSAMSHVTGGGFPDNLPRVLPEGLGPSSSPAAWEWPALFRFIQEKGSVARGRDAPGLQLRRRDGPLRRPGPRGPR